MAQLSLAEQARQVASNRTLALEDRVRRVQDLATEARLQQGGVGAKGVEMYLERLEAERTAREGTRL
jgi:hypothetical protein